jgi:hypothetical protein
VSAAGEGDDLRYFQSLEEAFIRLRGAPLLLSPADWQVAQRWRTAGIPLDFAIAAMAELFARRRERGAEDRVSSLRYCARAVESGWRRAEELAGPIRRGDEPALDAPARLQALARAIPRAWPQADAVAARITELGGDAASIESSLQALDDALLETAEARLDAAGREALDEWLERRVESLRSRFEPEDLVRAVARLRARELRRRCGLPLLSLFSPDAEPGERDARPRSRLPGE